MAPRRPRKNDEAVESLIRNPSSKTDFRPIGNQQVITNIIFQIWKHPLRLRMPVPSILKERFSNLIAKIKTNF